MFERFTTDARDLVCVHARDESRSLGHAHIGTEHLLLGMLGAPDSRAGVILRATGLDHDRVRGEVARLVGPATTELNEEDAAALRTVGIDLDTVLARIEESLGPDALEPPPFTYRRGLFGRITGHTRFTPRARKVLELALRETLRLKHRTIGTEHILLGLIREGDGLAAKVITEAGVDLDDLRDATLAALRTAA